ncbi:hypothetical protein pb186bvf_004969 [Paramecium bursaria]
MSISYGSYCQNFFGCTQLHFIFKFVLVTFFKFVKIKQLCL